MENKQLVCIDLGTSKLGISLSHIGEGGKIKVEHYVEYPSQGLVHAHLMSSDKLASALRYAISQFERAQGITVTNVVVSSQKYGVRLNEVEAEMEITSGKSISKEDIDNLADMAWSMASQHKEEGEDVITIVPQSYNTEDEWNVNPSDIVGMRGRKLTGLYKVFLANENIKNNMEDTLREAGFATPLIRFAPDAVGRSVLFPNEMAAGVALIDMGAGATSVSIYEGGVLRHYGAVPFGGNSITADIRNQCELNENIAENIKMGFGGCIPTRLGELGEKTLHIHGENSAESVVIPVKYLSEIITARVAEIVDAILYEIQTSGYANSLKSGIVLCGGCADMLNLKAFISERSGYTVRVAGPNRRYFDAGVEFFRPEAACSAGLIEDQVYNMKSSCVDEPDKEPNGTMTELFEAQNTDVEEKTPEKKGFSFGGLLFGSGGKKQKEDHHKEAEKTAGSADGGQSQPFQSKKKTVSKKNREDEYRSPSLFSTDDDTMGLNEV